MVSKVATDCTDAPSRFSGSSGGARSSTTTMQHEAVGATPWKKKRVRYAIFGSGSKLNNDNVIRIPGYHTWGRAGTNQAPEIVEMPIQAATQAMKSSGCATIHSKVTSSSKYLVESQPF